jgi:hypothetical protein
LRVIMLMTKVLYRQVLAFVSASGRDLPRSVAHQNGVLNYR